MKPQSPKDKVRNDPFIADHSCFIGYAATTYKAVWKMVKAKVNENRDAYKWRGVTVEHGVKELLKCKEDIDAIRIMAARYIISDYGRKGQYILDYTPSYRKVFKTRVGISKRLKAHPDKTFLLLYALAGHGM